jgi:hypothetical protein
LARKIAQSYTCLACLRYCKMISIGGTQRLAQVPPPLLFREWVFSFAGLQAPRHANFEFR